MTAIFEITSAAMSAAMNRTTALPPFKLQETLNALYIK